MINRGHSIGSTLRVGGGFTAVFSLVVGLLVLFVIPGACSFLGGIQLIILAFLLIVGVIAFSCGQFVLKRST